MRVFTYISFILATILSSNAFAQNIEYRENLFENNGFVFSYCDPCKENCPTTPYVKCLEYNSALSDLIEVNKTKNALEQALYDSQKNALVRCLMEHGINHCLGFSSLPTGLASPPDDTLSSEVLTPRAIGHNAIVGPDEIAKLLELCTKYPKICTQISRLNPN